jgi:hypothetical protein
MSLSRLRQREKSKHVARDGVGTTMRGFIELSRRCCVEGQRKLFSCTGPLCIGTRNLSWKRMMEVWGRKSQREGGTGRVKFVARHRDSKSESEEQNGNMGTKNDKKRGIDRDNDERQFQARIPRPNDQKQENMNAIISPRDIEQRLASEQTTLKNSTAREEKLVVQRVTALETGTDAEVDAIEKQLSEAQQTIDRCNERIALLDSRLAEAQEQERNGRLDEIAAKANEARLEGEKLIREYAKHAKQVATVLRRIESFDETISECNVVLERAGRAQVPSSNQIRHSAVGRFTREVTKRISVQDSRHPLYGKADVVRSGEHWFDRNTRSIIDDVEVVVIEKKSTDGDIPPALYEVVLLPAADARPAATVDADFKVKAAKHEPIYEWKFANYQPPISHHSFARTNHG